MFVFLYFLPEMTKLDSWVRADEEGEGGVGGGVPHKVGFVVNLFRPTIWMMLMLTKCMMVTIFSIINIICIVFDAIIIVVH